MPPSRPPHRAFRLTDTIAGWFGGANPAEWLTIGSFSHRAGLLEVGGRRYLLEISPSRGFTRNLRGADGRGTLSYAGTDTEVTLTEVTDPGLKHQVVIAYAAVKPRVLFASGEDKNRPVRSMLVIMGLARDDTPGGLLQAVPQVGVYEVSPLTDEPPGLAGDPA